MGCLTLDWGCLSIDASSLEMTWAFCCYREQSYMESVVTFLQDVVPQVTFLCHVFTHNNSCYKCLTALLILVLTARLECVLEFILEKWQHWVCATNSVCVLQNTCLWCAVGGHGCPIMQWTKEMAELLTSPETNKLSVLMREALERFHKTKPKNKQPFCFLFVKFNWPSKVAVWLTSGFCHFLWE